MQLGTDPTVGGGQRWGSAAGSGRGTGLCRYAGKRGIWTPRPTDSNNDGLFDGVECISMRRPILTCPDTDKDGTPDAFDDDNDGDGVRDGVDSAS